MVVGMAGNVITVSAEEKYDLTLYSIDTTDPDFEDWLANVEDATGLNINVIAAPIRYRYPSAEDHHNAFHRRCFRGCHSDQR